MKKPQTRTTLKSKQPLIYKISTKSVKPPKAGINSPKSPKHTVSWYKKSADKWFSVYIRLRDSDKNGMVKCITCPTVKPWKEMQNGHFVTRSVSLLRYDDENCNGQCPACNVWKAGELYTYGKELDLKYGEGTAERLHSQRYTTHKFTVQELLDIIEEAKSNIKHYET